MKKYFYFPLIIILIILLSPFSFSQQSAKNIVWDNWKFLIGNWEGEGSGKPGEGRGFFSFKFDLEEKILIRRNHSEYPATKNNPAIIHDDLLIIYKDFPGNPDKSIYFDNEGHVINYSINFSKDSTVVFTSEIIPKAPRFRLSYILSGVDGVKIIFEIAPPDKPETFSKYLEGFAHKIKSG
jgi:hypothetical protein